MTSDEHMKHHDWLRLGMLMLSGIVLVLACVMVTNPHSQMIDRLDRIEKRLDTQANSFVRLENHLKVIGD